MTAVWTPDPRRAAHSQLARFQHLMRAAHGAGTVGDDYVHLHAWSVREKATFWRELWRLCDVSATGIDGGDPLLPVGTGLDRMQPPTAESGPRWFPNARLNYAEHLVRHRDDQPAIVAWTERGRTRTWTYAELFAEVARVARGLRALGVSEGDRVAAFMPNVGETVIAMIAAASLGAVWTSCSPDFGFKGVMDRFGQVEPTILITTDAYCYGDRIIATLDRARELCDALPSVRHLVVVPYLDSAPSLHGVEREVAWHDLGAAPSATPFDATRVPFDHPLFIMYSSGTTGLPKCMVHGHGGTLLQHLKEHVLHGDLKRDSRIFYYTTCGWMMWNWLVTSLAVGATVVLYDGSPTPPAEKGILWRLAAEERLTHFGTSAKFLATAEKLEHQPARDHDLSALEVIYSTGSPLAEHSYDWVTAAISPSIRLSSISGGTDLISCFALGAPTLPVHRGELQCLGLGMAVEVWDADANPVIGMPGELVCTKPFPSMPVAFWNDPDGRKYRAAYFEQYDGAWRHGDWAQRTPNHGLVILGRSDATLNPGGVRIGTAEIYRQVELVPEVLESLVIGQDITIDGAPDVRIVLFVRLREEHALDEALVTAIRARIRAGASPHHVPKVILAVPDLPRTVSGKITEMAVRDIVHGKPVLNTDALANPGALEFFRALASSPALRPS
ncbi:MAG TPA: acetoacetate--CoA ligase [Gemmatimonadaceae bacterium]|nr:acetoacetate--CoA ligase [Gemmatimonadaceae bacterium]